MVKKLFALASVSALAGVVAAAGAGCTSETVTQVTDEDAGPKDAGRDRTPPATGDDDDDDVPPSCAATDPIDQTKFPYTKALHAPGACSNADVAKLTAYFDANSSKQDFSVAAWAAEVGEDCAKCVFTDTAADAWGPIVVKDDELDVVNRGGCIEIASKNEACGKAYQQVLDCGIYACFPSANGGFGTCKTQAEFDECRADTDTIYAGPCADAIAAVQTECGSSLGAYEEACTPPQGAKYIFEATIPAHCGGESPDAGE